MIRERRERRSAQAHLKRCACRLATRRRCGGDFRPDGGVVCVARVLHTLTWLRYGSTRIGYGSTWIRYRSTCFHYRSTWFASARSLPPTERFLGKRYNSDPAKADIFLAKISERTPCPSAVWILRQRAHERSCAGSDPWVLSYRFLRPEGPICVSPGQGPGFQGSASRRGPEGAIPFVATRVADGHFPAVFPRD